jgi:hypothetical protein
MEQTRLAKEIIECNEEGGRNAGRPTLTWLEDGENDFREMERKGI